MIRTSSTPAVVTKVLTKSATCARAAGSLAATALTVKEGLLSALPVIPGTFAGSGGGGGGGGTGGSGPASACLNPAAYTSPSNVHLDYGVSGAFTGSSVSDTVSALNVIFEGQTATEFRSTQTTSYTGQPTILSSSSSYAKLENLDVVTYGSTSDITTPLTGTVKSVFSPPSRDKRYSLGVGESATQTYNITSTSTFTGLPTITQTTLQTETVKYLGHETVTVPAGTFDTCKFEQGNGSSTVWIAAGSAAGVAAKSSSTSQGTTVILELRSGTINGTAIRP